MGNPLQLSQAQCKQVNPGGTIDAGRCWLQPSNGAWPVRISPPSETAGALEVWSGPVEIEPGTTLTKDGKQGSVIVGSLAPFEQLPIPWAGFGAGGAADVASDEPQFLDRDLLVWQVYSGENPGALFIPRPGFRMVIRATPNLVVPPSTYERTVTLLVVTTAWDAFGRLVEAPDNGGEVAGVVKADWTSSTPPASSAFDFGDTGGGPAVEVVFSDNAREQTLLATDYARIYVSGPFRVAVQLSGAAPPPPDPIAPPPGAGKTSSEAPGTEAPPIPGPRPGARALTGAARRAGLPPAPAPAAPPPPALPKGGGPSPTADIPPEPRWAGGVEVVIHGGGRA